MGKQKREERDASNARFSYGYVGGSVKFKPIYSRRDLRRLGVLPNTNISNFVPSRVDSLSGSSMVLNLCMLSFQCVHEKRGDKWISRLVRCSEAQMIAHVAGNIGLHSVKVVNVLLVDLGIIIVSKKCKSYGQDFPAIRMRG